MAYFPFCLESWIFPHERCNRQHSGKHHTTSPSQLDFLPPPGLHPRAESSRQVRFRCTRAFRALGKLFSLPPSCKAMGDMCSWLLLLVNYLRRGWTPISTSSGTALGSRGCVCFACLFTSSSPSTTLDLEWMLKWSVEQIDAVCDRYK